MQMNVSLETGIISMISGYKKQTFSGASFHFTSVRFNSVQLTRCCRVFYLGVSVCLSLFFCLSTFNLSAQDSRQIEISAQEILARVDRVMQYPDGELKGSLMHILPTGKSTAIKLKALATKEDYIFQFSNQSRGAQMQVLYNLNGEDIWVYNVLSLKLFHKVDVDRYDDVLNSNYNFFDLSNADLQSNYTAKIEKETLYKEKNVVILTLTPLFKGGGYGNLVLYVDKATWVPLRIDYQDNDRVTVKTMSIGKIAVYNNRSFPVRYDMLHISSGTLSILEFTDYDSRIDFDKKIFRHENMGTVF